MNNKWPMVPLGDVLSERQEVPSEDDLLSGNVRIVEKIGFSGGRIHLRVGAETKTGMILIRPGDLVVSGINAAKGAIAIYDAANEEPIAATIHYGAYVPNADRVSVKFLWWMLRSGLFRKLLLEYVPGGIKTELKAKRLLPIPVPMPSLIEQQRVVAWVEELATQIQAARGLRAEATERTEGLFFAECEEVLRTLEATYPCKQLDQLVDTSRGISYGIVQTGSPVEDGVPTLRAGDLQWFRCDTANVKRVSREVENGYRRTRLRGGELLLRIRGGVGEVGVCPSGMIGGNVSREIAVIPLTDDVFPQYAMYIMAAPTIQERMAGHVKGTSYVGLNLKDVRTLKLPVPPLFEQRRIVAELDAYKKEVDGLKRLQAKTSEELDALLPSVLDRAFSGEL